MLGIEAEQDIAAYAIPYDCHPAHFYNHNQVRVTQLLCWGFMR